MRQSHKLASLTYVAWLHKLAKLTYVPGLKGYKSKKRYVLSKKVKRIRIRIESKIKYDLTVAARYHDVSYITATSNNNKNMAFRDK